MWILLLWFVGGVHVYPRPLQDTFQTKHMLAALQRGHGLFVKGAQADIAPIWIFSLSTRRVWHGGRIHVLKRL